MNDHAMVAMTQPTNSSTQIIESPTRAAEFRKKVNR